MTLRYWHEEDRESLGKARSYAELLLIAKRVIKRMPKPVAQVCGPITTGGHGEFQQNIATLKAAINRLSELGENVFDQTPFQERMEHIMGLNGNGKDYDHDLLVDFYQPLFENGMIDVLYFIPGWESSVGGRWEHEQGKRLGIPIHYM